jgi:hypothetical protein
MKVEDLHCRSDFGEHISEDAVHGVLEPDGIVPVQL